MTSRRDAKSPTTPPPAPPYYIATAPLFIGDQFSRAFNPGDRVPVEHVDRFGWHDKVRAPEGYAAPTSKTTEPETPDSGQATTEGKDA
ncbi:hypothetical protein AB0L05_27670 [Nonomuraea pusilla]|uniref:hypothetical protein n=1 Tax=Nonomuraea pusilla TaxID=46177 RepID=UPI003326B4F4